MFIYSVVISNLRNVSYMFGTIITCVYVHECAVGYSPSLYTYTSMFDIFLVSPHTVHAPRYH